MGEFFEARARRLVREHQEEQLMAWDRQTLEYIESEYARYEKTVDLDARRSYIDQMNQCINVEHYDALWARIAREAKATGMEE